MVNIKKSCQYLYNSLYIPIYLYDDEKKLIFCYPDQEKDTYPPSSYLIKLLESNKKVTYTMTQFFSYYGCIKIENSNNFIVIGPINDFPYSNDSLTIISKEFSITNSKSQILFEFFHNIPQQNIEVFINTMLLINYIINGTELTRKDIDNSIDPLFDISINQKFSEESYTSKEYGILNNNYQIENELIRYIESGNISKLKIFSARTKNAKVGVIAHNNLRQLKNMFIVAVTLVSRAAIRGGLSPSISYQLSDIYIQQAERLTDIDALKSILSQVQLDYANRVANTLIPSSADNILRQVIQYVRENTNMNITVEDVARHVSLSRPYLSRKVKNELGFDLSSFIRKCKLEEAKDLLLFSDKSISEISNFLCFSSQSHFHKAFKNQYSVTPHTFRKCSR
jgi:AraC-type DNA-binding domain-containing proteins